jgi:hypothetical protein
MQQMPKLVLSHALSLRLNVAKASGKLVEYLLGQYLI